MIRLPAFLLLALLAPALPAFGSADDVHACTWGERWEARIAACTRVIGSGYGSATVARAYLHRGEGRLVTGQTLEAVRDLRAALRLEPEMVSAMMVLGAAYGELGKPEQAFRWFNAAVARAPDAPEVWYWRARTEARLGLADAALADLDRVLGLDPDHHAARLHRAQLRCALGDVEGTVADFRHALAAGAMTWDRIARRLAGAGFPATPGGGEAGLDALNAWARAGCP